MLCEVWGSTRNGVGGGDGACLIRWRCSGGGRVLKGPSPRGGFSNTVGGGYRKLIVHLWRTQRYLGGWVRPDGARSLGPR